MKFIIKSIVFSFLFFSIFNYQTFWFWEEFKELENLEQLELWTDSTWIWIKVDNQENKNISNPEKIENSIIVTNIENSSNSLITPFCDISKLNKDKKWIKLTTFENIKVIQTYLNVYWFEILKESWLDAETIANWYTFWNSTNSKEWQNKAENHCLLFRWENQENNEKIENLFKQVIFYNTYYKNYHNELTNWIAPSFITWLIDKLNTLLIWVLMLTVWNIIYHVILIWYWDKTKSAQQKTQLMNWIWYFILVVFIKLWIVWTIITFVWFEWLDILKTFLWF